MTVSKCWLPELDDHVGMDLDTGNNKGENHVSSSSNGLPQNLFDIDDVEVEVVSCLSSRPSSVPPSDIADTSSGYGITFEMDNDPLPQAASRKRARHVAQSGESSDEEDILIRPVKKSSKKAKVGLKSEYKPCCKSNFCLSDSLKGCTVR